MLVIRLQRTGRTNLATYRLVLAEKSHAAKGRFQEILGHYLPTMKDSPFKFDAERIQHWVSVGATPSDTAARLLKRNGVDGMDKFIKRYTKRRAKNAPPEEEEAPAPAPAAPAAEAPAEEPQASQPTVEEKPAEQNSEDSSTPEQKESGDSEEKTA